MNTEEDRNVFAPEATETAKLKLVVANLRHDATWIRTQKGDYHDWLRRSARKYRAEGDIATALMAERELAADFAFADACDAAVARLEAIDGVRTGQ